ncbi:PadR family transcriptional regulator [Microbacterium sp. SORGH_AS_0888]|uniref:PadR family transcriptional regulator n=1 Tax=Microbacterium sp. SORGH_AS_0888 TaxID=3041791 RepID=UPI00277FFAAF|nr:PadR family transcriptional regulator [Microbacterium sp. SORGH_AS_0888]MDQ1129918.1 DNA-binding PadR family transcriptional regulator [Microbacterium sp. SORGH_AS_0888]
MALRHAILAALSRGKPRTGYELNASFSDVNDRAWHASPSQVYSELARMEQLGLIDITERNERGRTSYIINDNGVAELQRWLLHDQPDHGIRDDAMLRLLNLWVLDRADADYLLNSEITFQRQRQFSLSHLLSHWEQERDDPDNAVWRNRRALYTLWLRQTNLMLEWLDELRVVLENPDIPVPEALTGAVPDRA